MSHETERTIRITPFSGKKKDWRMWSTKFLAKARAKGFGDVLTGKTVPPKFDTVFDLSKADDCQEE
jgi:hypothetical protein